VSTASLVHPSLQRLYVVLYLKNLLSVLAL